MPLGNVYQPKKEIFKQTSWQRKEWPTNKLRIIGRAPDPLRATQNKFLTAN